MKRLTISTLLSGVLFLTSCNDFLNQEPLDQLSPNEYLTTESNIAAFATDQYQVLPTHGTYGYGTFEIDNNTDNMAGMQPNVMYAPGYWKVGQEGGSWYFLIFTDAIISLKMCFHRMKTMPLSETRPISNTISEKCISSELSCILKD